jgi:PAS domain S-box-containing protein
MSINERALRTARRGDRLRRHRNCGDSALDSRTIEHAVDSMHCHGNRGTRRRATNDRAFAGIAEVDLEGRFLRANARFYELTGYSPDELRSYTFEGITHPKDSASDVDKFEALVAGKFDTYQTEKRFIRKDSSVLWVALSASMVRDEDGRPLVGLAVTLVLAGLAVFTIRRALGLK